MEHYLSLFLFFYPRGTYSDVYDVVFMKKTLSAKLSEAFTRKCRAIFSHLCFLRMGEVLLKDF